MPPRSNDFQRVIFMIQQDLAPNSAVRESASLADIHTGTLREVDIVIETQVATYPVIISVECRDQARPQNVAWIDEMDSKHRSLPTNQLVLVSSSGFTPAAVKKAKACNIELVVPKELSGDQATAIAARVQGLRLRTAQMKVVDVIAKVEKSGSLPVESIRDEPDSLLLFSSTGSPIGNLVGARDFLMSHADWSQVLPTATGDEKGFELSVEPPTYTVGRQSSRPRHFYLELSDGKILRRILKLSIFGDVDITEAEIPLTHAEVRGSAFSHGRVTLFGTDSIVVVSYDSDGGGKLSVAPGTNRPVAHRVRRSEAADRS